MTQLHREIASRAKRRLATSFDRSPLRPFLECLEQRALLSGMAACVVAPVENVGDVAAHDPRSATVVRRLNFRQFADLLPSEAVLLTRKQLAAIPDAATFAAIPANAREALTPTQVQSLTVTRVGLENLSEKQRGVLSVRQIRTLPVAEFQFLSASQVAALTTTQVGSIRDAWTFSLMPEASRAAFTVAQVQQLDMRSIPTRLLTDTQVTQLSTSQIATAHAWNTNVATLKYYEFDELSPPQIQQLTPEQIATIPERWWFSQIPDDSRNALTADQVRALDIEDVGLEYLSPHQICALTTDQVREADYYDLQFVLPGRIAELSSEQLASIPDGWWFGRIPDAARAALTDEQVRVLQVAELGLEHLTASQVDALSVDQIHSLHYAEFQFLDGEQSRELTAGQIAAIPDSWWFSRMSDAARAALTDEQIQALDVSSVGLEHLTDSQVDALAVEQIRSLEYCDFAYLDGEQSPTLTPEQLASIPDGWWFSRMPDDARAALTAEQVHALDVSEIGLDDLTEPQVAELTDEQIRDVQFWDFEYLSDEQSPVLTTDQIGSIPDGWWFSLMSDEARWALTAEQVQSLNTAEVSIDYLLAGQRDELTDEQVRRVNFWDFDQLTAEQVANLTAEQMESIPDEWWFWRMPDDARAVLTRDQLFDMDPHVFAHVMGLGDDLAPPEQHDHEDHDHDAPAPDPNLPHPDDLAKQREHVALFNLVPRDTATHVTIASGDWSNPATWQNGRVPGRDADVLVATGTVVTFDAVYTDVNPLHTVRVDGTLEFAHDVDTQLMADTIIVDGKGIFRVGTAAQPIDAGVAARIVIADTGPINTTWDPHQLSRGLISHGQVEMVGQFVTPFVSLAVDPSAGDTRLVLDATPVNWRVGDRLVLTGTNSWADDEDFEDEEFAIAAISSNVVTIDQALEYDHHTPAGHDLSVYVANVNRNVVVMSQNPDINARRGHVMFMHSAKVQVHNVGFYGLGRTDKRNPANDPVFEDDGNLIPNTGLNPRGRYAVHFHRTGSLATGTPAVITGSAVVDSPGWGFVNHDSYVNMEANVAFHVVGASFVTEIGSEIGSFRRNLSIETTGSGDGLEDRQDIFDFGHGGHGFWFQGPGVEVEGNIASGNADAAFIFFTASSEAEFAAANLADPSLAAGREFLPVGTVPLRLVRDNVAFASADGLETWFHLTSMNDGQSVIEDFTSWNTRGTGVFTPYTGNTTLRNVTVIGYLDWPWGTGFDRNNVTNNMTYDNVRVFGFEVGISVPVNRATVIDGGHFEAIRAIEIYGAEDTIRTVDVIGDPQFVRLSADQLHHHEQFDIYLDGRIEMEHRDIETLFTPDIIRLGTVRLNGRQVYYDKQASDFVPFPAGDSPDFIPPELLGKTNRELWTAYGLAPAGVIAPPDAVRMPRINGLVGSPSTYLPALELASDKYINQLADYQLSYFDARGDLVNDPTPVNLREGWNLITRTVHNHVRTFFVFGDTQAPTFELSDETKLVINPRGLKFGFIVRGTVFDNSFGHMGFHKEFDDLESRPILQRANGSRYILLEFTIRDFAGNTTDIRLELTLDPNAPIIQGTDQRDLPPRELPETLYELLEYYMLTGQTENIDLNAVRSNGSRRG